MPGPVQIALSHKAWQLLQFTIRVKSGKHPCAWTNPQLNYTLLEKLMKLDLEEEGVDTLDEDEEQDLFALLQSEEHEIEVKNCVERMVSTEMCW